MFRLLTNIKNSISSRGKPFSRRFMTTKISSNDHAARIMREYPDNLSTIALNNLHKQLRMHNIPSSDVAATDGIRIDKPVFDTHYDVITTLHGLTAKTTTHVTIRNINDDVIDIEVEALNTKPLNAIADKLQSVGISCKIEPYAHGSNPRLFASSNHPEFPNMIKQTLDAEKNKEELSVRLRLSSE